MADAAGLSRILLVEHPGALSLAHLSLFLSLRLVSRELSLSFSGGWQALAEELSSRSAPRTRGDERATTRREGGDALLLEEQAGGQQLCRPLTPTLSLSLSVCDVPLRRGEPFSFYLPGNRRLRKRFWTFDVSGITPGVNACLAWLTVRIERRRRRSIMKIRY